MKKQMKWLLAALALTALATPAFAVTADMTGSLSVRGIATNNFDGDSNAPDHGKFFDQRFRLFTGVAANENVKAVLGLEVDNIWGGGGPNNIGRVGADGAGLLEVKHLYLDFKLPTLGANVKAGVQAFNFGRGLVINDDASGIAVSIPCPAIPDNTLSLTYIKTQENSEGPDNKNDGDFYGAKYTLKMGDVKVAPYIGTYNSNQATLATVADPQNNLHAAFYGVDLDGKSGDLSYAATIISNQWSRGSADNGNSVSLYGKGTYAMGNTTLSLEAGSYGDQDFDQFGNSVSLAQSATSGPVVNFSEIFTGGMYTTNNTAYNANVNLTDSASNAGTLYSTNFQFLKVGAVQKLNDKMTVSGYVMQVQEKEDTSANGAARKFGQEIDAYFDYAIVPGLGLNVAAAYLLADDEFGEDNAYKLATSLNYKF